MNWQTIRLLIAHEFRLLMRDRRTVVLAFILPLIMAPLILFGIKFMGEWRKEKLVKTNYTYSVEGAYADSVRALVNRGLALRAIQRDARLYSYSEVKVTNPDSSLQVSDIHFFIQAEDGIKADALEAATITQEDRPQEDRPPEESVEPPDHSVITARYPGVPVISFYYMGNRDASNSGARRLRNMMLDARNLDRQEMLKLRGFTEPSENVFFVLNQDLATLEQVAGSNFGRFLPILLIIFTLSGATIVAMDSIAGEKERGSLETLLTTSVRHIEIIAAKQMTILIVALGIVFIQVANLLFYITLGYIDLPEGISGSLPPLALLTVFILYIPVAIVISSILLMVSAFAKSYKETQLYYLPVFFSLCILAASAFLPAISLNSFVVLIPIANVSVAVREIMVGIYHWPMLVLTCLVMMALAFFLLRQSTRMLSAEKLITSQDSDEADLIGGAALLPKRVLIWFVAMWVLFLTIPANIPALATLEGQFFFNMFFVMLGVPILMIRVYRLDWRKAFAIRPVKPIIWPIILVLIPATQFTGTGIVALANELFPFPEELLEEFARQLIPEDYPIWKVLLMLAITPGIVEEIAFRGMLLHGLHRRIRPIWLIITVGIIFGIFHTSLFRIIPTGYIGMVLTAVAVLTGSIFPCMLLHAGNNAFSILLYQYGIQIEELNEYYYVMSVFLFVGAFYLLYKNRTPYPDLLPHKKRKMISD
jgi:sodium transport system permease protein